MASKDKLPLEKDGKRLTRKFLGELFPTCTKDHNELKAYTKGQEKYRFKNDEQGFPKYYPVRQEYSYV